MEKLYRDDLFGEERSLSNSAVIGNTVFNGYWWNWNKNQQRNMDNFSAAGGMLKEQTKSWRQIGQKPST